MLALRVNRRRNRAESHLLSLFWLQQASLQDSRHLCRPVSRPRSQLWSLQINRLHAPLACHRRNLRRLPRIQPHPQPWFLHRSLLRNQQVNRRVSRRVYHHANPAFDQRCTPRLSLLRNRRVNHPVNRHRSRPFQLDSQRRDRPYILPQHRTRRRHDRRVNLHQDLQVNLQLSQRILLGNRVRNPLVYRLRNLRKGPAVNLLVSRLPSQHRNHRPNLPCNRLVAHRPNLRSSRLRHRVDSLRNNRLEFPRPNRHRLPRRSRLPSQVESLHLNPPVVPRRFPQQVDLPDSHRRNHRWFLRLNLRLVPLVSQVHNHRWFLLHSRSVDQLQSRRRNQQWYPVHNRRLIQLLNHRHNLPHNQPSRPACLQPNQQVSRRINRPVSQVVNHP